MKIKYRILKEYYMYDKEPTYLVQHQIKTFWYFLTGKTKWIDSYYNLRTICRFNTYEEALEVIKEDANSIPYKKEVVYIKK